MTTLLIASYRQTPGNNDATYVYLTRLTLDVINFAHATQSPDIYIHLYTIYVLWVNEIIYARALDSIQIRHLEVILSIFPHKQAEWAKNTPHARDNHRFARAVYIPAIQAQFTYNIRVSVISESKSTSNTSSRDTFARLLRTAKEYVLNQYWSIATQYSGHIPKAYPCIETKLNLCQANEHHSLASTLLLLVHGPRYMHE